jgi:hypothetical protein
MIVVRQTGSDDPMEFEVTVREGASETRHRVTLRKSDHRRLAGDRAEPGRLVEAAFEFLLDHEPKESILSRFDVSVISSYFPDFTVEIKGYL